MLSRRPMKCCYAIPARAVPLQTLHTSRIKKYTVHWMFAITLPLTEFQSSLLALFGKLSFFSFPRLLVLAWVTSRLKIKPYTKGTKIIAGYVSLQRSGHLCYPAEAPIRNPGMSTDSLRSERVFHSPKVGWALTPKDISIIIIVITPIIITDRAAVGPYSAFDMLL